jgi:mgtE-like transporter
MRGNIFGALGSRLGTAMHIGVFEVSIKRGTVLRSNLEASLALTLLMSFFMGVLAKYVTELVGIASISLSEFVFISVLGGILAGLVLVAFNVLIAREGYKRDWDVDNITAPLITAAGDIVTLPMLFLAAWIVMDFPVELVDSTSIFFVLLTGAMIFNAYRKRTIRMDEGRRILYQSAPVLFVCAILNIFAGVTIDSELDAFITAPALLVLLTPFLNEANALGGILTSRFGSMLHMGFLKPVRAPDRMAVENFMIIYTFSIVIFFIGGVAAHFVALAMGLGSPGLLEMAALATLAGLLTVTVLNVLSYYVAVYTFRFDLDPDDHSIPLTSSTIDLVGTLFFIGCILILGL